MYVRSSCIWLAAEFTDVIKCAASIHGVFFLLRTIDSPHLFAKKLKVKFILHAENDSYAPTQMINLKIILKI